MTHEQRIECLRLCATQRIRTISKVMPVITEVQTELLVALCVEMYFSGRVDAAMEIVGGG